MTVRAKVQITKKTDTGFTAVPVVDGSEENKTFFEATPGGSIELTVVNKSALDQFEVGKFKYVDFVDAE